jgi:DNA-directed RNA polymerase subunit E'
MFYLIEVEDYIRVEPRLFGLPTIESVEQVGEGVIIPGDGAAYYRSRFKLLVWKPELQELNYGIVSEITSFGAFIDLGVIKGMIHISQTMDDYVSFSKSNTLIGKASKRGLKIGDLCLARVVAISHKGGELKIGLTMRQPGLGKLEWIKEDEVKKAKAEQKELRDEEKAAKGKSEKSKGGKKKKK